MAAVSSLDLLANLREILGEFVPSEYIEHIILEAESELDYSDDMKRQMEAVPS